MNITQMIIVCCISFSGAYIGIDVSDTTTQAWAAGAITIFLDALIVDI